jgi:hypothetical protein
MIMVLYGISYAAFSNISSGMVALKLGHRTLVQASRVTFYAGEATLRAVGAGGIAGRGGAGRGRAGRAAASCTLCLLGLQQRPCLGRLLRRRSSDPTPSPISSNAGQTAAERAAAQPLLAAEAALMEAVFAAHLYGGPTLPDSVRDGARDDFTGALFRDQVRPSVGAGPRGGWRCE